jgi:hypothetical protein
VSGQKRSQEAGVNHAVVVDVGDTSEGELQNVQAGHGTPLRPWRWSSISPFWIWDSSWPARGRWRQRSSAPSSPWDF